MAKTSTSATTAFLRPGKPEGRSLTSDQISEHLKAFRKAGGTVEVLGTTPTFKHIGVSAKPAIAVAAKPAAAAPAKPKK